MSAHNLQDFITALEQMGELRRVVHPVSCRLQITDIADRVIKAGGPALLFEQVQETPEVPVAIGLYGSDQRMTAALHDAPANIAARIQELLHLTPPSSLAGKLKTGLKLLPTLKSLGMRLVGDGLCQEVRLSADEVDLTRLPILTCWPGDGGPFITLPMVFTHHPQTGRRNVGMYRMQVYDARTTGMHWQIHKVGAAHQQAAGGARIEVAVALGGDPCLPFCALAPLPEEIDEMLFAGFLRGKPLDMVRCQTVDIQVPASCEYVLEGYLDPAESRPEGPFGDHTGYYTPIESYPVFHLTALTHRRRPVYPATIVGMPPMEDAWLGNAVGTIFLPLIRTQLPELVGLNLPVESCFHNLAIVSIRKRYPLHAFKVMHALWGLGQLMFSKIIVVVDEDVDVHNLSEVLWRATNNIDPGRDVQIVKGPVDSLNHAAPQVGFGTKMGLDATRKWPSEGYQREWPGLVQMDPATAAQVDAMWANLGLGDLLPSPSVGGHLVAAMPRPG